MRRWSGSAVATLLAVSLLAAPVGAFAADEVASVGVVLAADADEDLGPDPQPRDAQDNAARTEGGYEDQETPFTWGAAWILTFAGVAGLVLLAGLYELLVRRPARETSG